MKKTESEQTRHKIALTAAVKRLESLKNRLPNASAFPEIASNGVPSREDIMSLHREMLSIIGCLCAEVHVL